MTYDARAVQHAYATIADGYADTFGDDLERSSIDRSVLDAALASLPASPLLVDLGCGPAQVARFLGARGCRAIGLDLTQAMLELARQRTAHLPLIHGDLLRLPIREHTIDGVFAWFSLHNLPRDLLTDALSEARRVLREGGAFVMTTHVGAGHEVIEQVLRGRTEQVLVTYYEPNELASLLADQGFRVTNVRSRPPLDHERAVTKLFITGVAE